MSTSETTHKYSLVYLSEDILPDLLGSSEELLKCVASYWSKVLKDPRNQNPASGSQLILIAEVEISDQGKLLKDAYLQVETYPNSDIREWVSMEAKLWYSDPAETLLMTSAAMIDTDLAYDCASKPFKAEVLGQYSDSVSMLDYLLSRCDQ